MFVKETHGLLKVADLPFTVDCVICDCLSLRGFLYALCSSCNQAVQNQMHRKEDYCNSKRPFLEFPCIDTTSTQMHIQIQRLSTFGCLPLFQKTPFIVLEESVHL